MPGLLLEIGTEEIPARMQETVGLALQDAALATFRDFGVEPEGIFPCSAPRRIALIVESLADQVPPQKLERLGPAENAPQKAVEGFLRSVGAKSLAECTLVEAKKGRKWTYLREIPAMPMQDALPAWIISWIETLSWPKSMRMADQSFRWIRPLTHITARFAGKVLDGALDLRPGSIEFAGAIAGHPFLAPGWITPKEETLTAYLEAGYEGKLCLDRTERKKRITDGIQSLARKLGAVALLDEDLLAENAGLAAWPVVGSAAIDPRFAQPEATGGLPVYVAHLVQKGHQKTFTFVTPQGELAPHFAFIADRETQEQLAFAKSGNERATAARLADADFYWRNDLEANPKELLGKLRQLRLHQELGSVADQCERLGTLTQIIHTALAPSLSGEQEWNELTPNDLRLGGSFAKLDLASSSVFEFPELQGYTGGRIGKHQNLFSDAIALGIEDQYKPLGPNDSLPRNLAGEIIALAGKLDLLAGYWRIDEVPTGSRDPFGLRRAALGLLRIVLERKHHLPLRSLLMSAMQAYDDVASPLPTPEQQQRVESLLNFVADRMRVLYRSRNLRHDVIDAILAKGTRDDFCEVAEHVEALSLFMERPENERLLTAWRRSASILKGMDKELTGVNGSQEATNWSADDFPTEAETNLWAAKNQAERLLDVAFDAGNWGDALNALADLGDPIDQFFDQVKVMDNQPEVRRKRLGLLFLVCKQMLRVAAFDQIQGGRST